MQQRTFASVAWEKKGKITRRERFLAEMDAVIPWSRLLALIEPHYPKAGNGTQPKPMEQMLRIYFMQNWFNRRTRRPRILCTISSRCAGLPGSS